MKLLPLKSEMIVKRPLYCCLALIATVLCFLLASCGQSSPSTVYGSFFKALGDHNGDVSWQLIDRESQQAFGNTAIFLTQTGTEKIKSGKDAWKWVVQQHGAEKLPDPYDLTSETIDGEKAVLSFKGGKQINLIKEGNSWKVVAFNSHP